MLNPLATKLGKDVRAFSAGSSPNGRVNPLAIEVLRGAGVDIRAFRSKSWEEFTRAQSPRLTAVITVCDRAAAERCPIFCGAAGESPVQVHWGYPDPSSTTGTEEDKWCAFELTRQAIAYRMPHLLALPLADMGRVELRNALAEIGRS